MYQTFTRIYFSSNHARKPTRNRRGSICRNTLGGRRIKYCPRSKNREPHGAAEKQTERERKREGGEKLKMYDSTECETTRCVGLSSVKLYEERDNQEICRGSKTRSVSRIFFGGEVGCLPLRTLSLVCATSHK